VAHQFEARVADQVLDVAPRAGEEIVDAEDLGALGEQAVAKMRAEEAGAPGHQNTLRKMASHPSPVSRLSASKRVACEIPAQRGRAAIVSISFSS
jgi:hypothetical protein